MELSKGSSILSIELRIGLALAINMANEDYPEDLKLEIIHAIDGKKEKTI